MRKEDLDRLIKFMYQGSKLSSERCTVCTLPLYKNV